MVAEGEWVEFRRVANLPSATMLVELLASKQVPARIETQNLLPGLESYFVVAVPSGLIHRARWVAPEAEFEEAELAYLATGKLGPENKE